MSDNNGTSKAASIAKNQHELITEIAKQVGVDEKRIPRNDSASMKALTTKLSGGSREDMAKAAEEPSEGEQLVMHVQQNSEMLEAILEQLDADASKAYGSASATESGLDTVAGLLDGGA